MARVAFRLQIRPDRIADYDEAHRHVWPEMLQLLKSVGISEYSIFRRGTELFLFMHVENFEQAWQTLDQHPVNVRWQAATRPLFEPLPALEPGERLPMLKEVFYLE